MENTELQGVKADVREMTDFIYDLDDFVINEEVTEESEEEIEELLN